MQSDQSHRGQDHPLVLTAAARRQRRAQSTAAEGPGEYATYDIAPGKATLGHHVAWMLAPQEALDAVDHLDRFASLSDPL